MGQSARILFIYMEYLVGNRCLKVVRNVKEMLNAIIKKEMYVRMMKNRKIALEKLTPIVLDSDQKEKINYENYKQILDTIMHDSNYRNIALTGSYGAGKSSVMNTYESETNIKTIHISLAKLNGEETDNVQTKLINQIIHQIDLKRVPQTKFKIKREISRKQVIGLSLLILIFIISLFYVVGVPKTQIPPDAAYSLYDSFFKYKQNIVMLVILLISFCVLVFLVVNAQLKRPLIKAIQVDKSQIELIDNTSEEDNEKEKFDKYMDEILYLFEKSNISALVIEDMDRLEDVKIFYELRQLNFLINKRMENKKENRSIKFIYMLRDELFKNSEERTKFFDIIVPIVPVMDNSNSYELLKKMMGTEWIHGLDQSYLKTICLFIRDYRLLKNIFNEFQIYYKQLCIDTYKYDPMKLFSMIVYKNIWASDFADLQQGKGVVYTALSEMDRRREEEIGKIEKAIEQMRYEIRESEEETLKNIDELDALFFSDSTTLVGEATGYYIVDGKSEHAFSERTEFIHSLKNATNVQWRRGNASGTKIVTKESIEKEFARLNTNTEYVARKNNIIRKSAQEKSVLENKIREMQSEIRSLQEEGYIELSKKTVGNDILQNIAELFTDEKKLILILLQDRMISKDYSSYMTYFYPYSISNEELRYLNNVYAKKNEATQINEKITHPNIVLAYIKKNDWESAALPNKEFYKYLIKCADNNLDKAINNLKRHSNIPFVVSMVQELDNPELGIWCERLLQEWEYFFDEMLSSRYITTDLAVHIIFRMIGNTYHNDFSYRTILDFFEEVENEVIKKSDISNIKVLKIINYHFQDISQIPDDIWDYIYENNLYKINKHNIDEILKRKSICFDEDEYYSRPFSVIMSNKNEPLAKYVLQHIEQYVQHVYIPFFISTSREQDAFIAFFNNPEISQNLKVRLAYEMPMEIDDIDDIDETIVRNQIVKYKKMEFINKNIVSVWKDEEEINIELYEYLKEKYMQEKCQLSLGFAIEYFDENGDGHPKSSKLISQLLHMEDLGAAYYNLVEDVKVRYAKLDSITWNEHQLEAIVGTKIIDMTENNLKLMRKLEKDSIFYKWIMNNISAYLQILKKEELRENNELLKIIALDGVDDNAKVKCIDMCTEKVPIDEKYNTRVVEAIFDNGLFDGNFIPVLRRYNSNRYGRNFSEKMGDYLIAYINDVIQLKFPLPTELLLHIMKKEIVTSANKKRVLAKQILFHNIQEVQECLAICAEKEVLSVFNGSKPKIEASEENRILLESLAKRNWISSFKAEGAYYAIFPKRKFSKNKKKISPSDDQE